MSTNRPGGESRPDAAPPSRYGIPGVGGRIHKKMKIDIDKTIAGAYILSVATHSTSVFGQWLITQERGNYT
jgi:hypothetical protein